MTISEIVLALPANQREKLVYALENDLTNQFVEYSPGRFVGVNILSTLTSLEIEDTKGHYSIGRIVQGQYNGLRVVGTD